ncbi:MAG: high-affinity nickel-transport family protein, partial [Candidatus Acidiferrales bacterium]
MVSLVSILAVGFFLGMRHATDADHVIAVSTILSRHRDARRALWLGFFWGLGHTLTILIVGAAIIFLGLVISPRLELSLELSVGAMLVFLGAANLASFVRTTRSIAGSSHDSSPIAHCHAHSHGDYVHSHPHSHAPEAHSQRPDQTPLAFLDRKLSGLNLYQHLRPLTVGVVHGLAGSAAVALLVLAAIPDSRWAIAYLLVFGAGTIAGMTLITLSLASTMRFAGRKHPSITRWLGVASGVASLAFGLFLAYR